MEMPEDIICIEPASAKADLLAAYMYIFSGPRKMIFKIDDHIGNCRADHEYFFQYGSSPFFRASVKYSGRSAIILVPDPFYID